MEFFQDEIEAIQKMLSESQGCTHKVDVIRVIKLEGGLLEDGWNLVLSRILKSMVSKATFYDSHHNVE